MRIVIVGTTGSGKSTLASELSELLAVPFVELDALHWGPNWQDYPDDVFRERVIQATVGNDWVVAGNYSIVRDIVWSRAQMLVWLDYPLPITLWRLFWRTIRRIRTQENLWNTDNYESWRAQFFDKNSLFIWAFKSHFRRSKQYPELLQSPEYEHLDVIRLSWPHHTERWKSEFVHEMQSESEVIINA